VSREHAVVRAGAEGLLVEDRHSTNGTFVDDTRVAPGDSRLARSGSRIVLGGDPPLVLTVVTP